MKPIYLEFCGVNSFSERAEIDFIKLTRYGIFGIFGDTGSGKSTILDCIAFAVYGEVGRARSGSIAEIINYKSEKAFVNFEFEIVYEGERRTFRIEREIKRKNAVQSARVYERKGETLSALSEGVRDSNALLKDIVGLEQRDFEKCIALPQGEFAQFVKSQRSDRLKLVSRLFNLEEYGERLVKKINAHHAALKGEFDVLSARLEPYADVSTQSVQRLQEEIVTDGETEKIERDLLARARDEEKRVTVLSQRRAERDKTQMRFRSLQSEKPQIEGLSADVNRLESAESYVQAEKEYRRAQEVEQRLNEKRVQTEKELREAEGQEKEASAILRKMRENDCTEALTAKYALAQEYGRTAGQIEKKEKELSLVRAKYRQEAETLKDFDYNAEYAALEEKRTQLGDGDFLSFVEARGKQALFVEEYATFANELCGLTEKYPVVEGDTLPLIERYRALSHTEGESYERLKEEFSARELAKKQLEQAFLQLEKKNGLLRERNERLQALQTRGVELKREVEELNSSFEQKELPAPEVIKKELDSWKRELQEKADRAEMLLVAVRRKTESFTQIQAEYASAQAHLAQAHKSVERAQSAGGFASIGEAQALTAKYGDAENARKRVESFQTEYAALSARLAEFEKENLSEGEEGNVLRLREECAKKQERVEEISTSLALKRDELKRQTQSLEKKRELESNLQEVAHKTQIFEKLKILTAGNKFIEFVAEEYLQNVAAGASGRLLSLTDGRYFLRYTAGTFVVGDNFNGGTARGVYTLSGGETFLVSLSLALSLSAEICAKSLRPIEFFFLDEGFGTLDERLVDTVMDSLERLKNEHFSIGIISHVEELKYRISSKLTVERASETHGSKIQAE